MRRLRVALLSGGISSERGVSLVSGDQVYAALDKEKYDVVRYDPATDLKQLVSDASDIDVAFIALHGPYGEDGTMQGLLDLLRIPYQGSGVLGSAAAMDKWMSKRLYEHAGLPVPAYEVLARGQHYDSSALAKKIGFPMFIKPRHGGSSIGTNLVKSDDQLSKALEQAFEHDNWAMIETNVSGPEITVGCIGNEDVETLPVVEIVPNTEYDFFDYEAKYKNGATREICPARIDPAIAKLAQSYGAKAHKALCCSGYSRTDMIVDNGIPYVLETNTIPGMTPVSLFPLAAKTAGISFAQLVDKLIVLALEAAAAKGGGRARLERPSNN